MRPNHRTNLNELIITALQEGPKSPRELCAETGYSSTYVRNHLMVLLDNEIVTNERRMKEVYYRLAPKYERMEPLLQVGNELNFTYIYLGQVTPSPYEDTKAIKAARFVGQLSVALCRTAITLQLIKEEKNKGTITQEEHDKQYRKLKRELRNLKARAMDELNKLQVAEQLLSQVVSNRNFWDLDDLQGLAAPQISRETGGLVPPKFNNDEIYRYHEDYNELDKRKELDNDDD